MRDCDSQGIQNGIGDLVMRTWKMEVRGPRKTGISKLRLYIKQNTRRRHGQTTSEKRHTRPQSVDNENSMRQPKINVGSKAEYQSKSPVLYFKMVNLPSQKYFFRQALAPWEQQPVFISRFGACKKVRRNTVLCHGIDITSELESLAPNLLN